MPTWIANFLAWLGLARRLAHVDASQRFRLRFRVVDPSGGPIPDVEVAIERPAEWEEQGPQSFVAGRTDTQGNIDAPADVFWAFETTTMPNVVWPRLDLVLRKAGHEARRPIDVASLPMSGAVRLVAVGDVILP